MSKYEYPHTLAAAKEREGSEWKLADGILSDVGPRSSTSAFRDCAAYLKENDIEYKVDYLRDLYQAAKQFKKGARAPYLPWLTPRLAHEAGTPVVVKRAIEAKKDKIAEEKGGAVFTPPTKRELRMMRSTINQHAAITEGLKIPTKQARQSSANDATPSELSLAIDFLGLKILINEAEQKVRRYIKRSASFEMSKRHRDYLLYELNDLQETLKVAFEVTENGNAVSEEAATFLRGA
ncbi:MAG: hypothetical protein WCF24_04695 [Acidimicrobiales bacterium]